MQGNYNILPNELENLKRRRNEPPEKYQKRKNFLIKRIWGDLYDPSIRSDREKMKKLGLL